VSYHFLEDIATADSAFEAAGKTPAELFSSAATALEEVQVDTNKIEARKQRVVNLESKTFDNLLFDFLNELVYLKDTEGLVFSKFDIKIQLDPKPLTLTATLFGEEIDAERHELRTDVKAVTKHMFGIARK
jgi:SHS2 domain-containing protein